MYNVRFILILIFVVGKVTYYIFIDKYFIAIITNLNIILLFINKNVYLCHENKKIKTMDLLKNIRRGAVFALFAMMLSMATKAQQIAFLSDPHIQDVIFHQNLLRTMDAQVQSTRLFNENIFAFRAALDDVAKRGIKYVVISGDVTDDGQVVNMQAAKKLLAEYEEKYGMLFFVTPGNHDPSSPFGKESFMKGMLALDGSSYTLVSAPSVQVPGYDLNFKLDKVNPDMYSLGHKGQMFYFSKFGYFPRQDYLYWATPFSKYKYEEYTYEKANIASLADERMFTYAGDVEAYETSYVVEPVQGIWLLSIDSGVYLPDGNTGKYKNSGVGYNNTLEHKPYLIPWIKNVCDEARRLGKHVIAFSHFPLLDCNDGASAALEHSWGRSKFDIERIPSEAVSSAMIEAGVRLHFAGHMHIFDIAKKTVEGNTMYNVQVPSLITGVPAYRILTVNENKAHLETVVMDNVDGFDSFFGQYRKELSYLKSKHKKPVWNTDILNSKNYGEFCDYVFRDLVRTRFSVRDLPKILQDELIPRNGQEILLRVSPDAEKDKSWTMWTGQDLVLDFYRLHYSGTLALPLIPQERLSQYLVLFGAIEKNSETSEFMTQMRDFATAFKCFLNDEDVVDVEI